MVERKDLQYLQCKRMPFCEKVILLIWASPQNHGELLTNQRCAKENISFGARLSAWHPEENEMAFHFSATYPFLHQQDMLFLYYNIEHSSNISNLSNQEEG